MKFSYRDTVKWHDTDANRCVRPSRILTYMQEAANLQMAANSRNLDKLRDEEGLAFLLSRISIRIWGDLHAYDPFDSETWICEGHGAATTRCFRILREGRAQSADEALEVLKSDLKALNADVQVSQEEYDEVVAIKSMFLLSDYQ